MDARGQEHRISHPQSINLSVHSILHIDSNFSNHFYDHKQSQLNLIALHSTSSVAQAVVCKS